jgi:tetratricopeptide (TPR) repeat protein
VTAAAGALVAGVVGLSAVLAVQTQAKADIARSLDNETRANTALAESNKALTRSQAAVQARYDLAVEAIKTFHTGVSEDFLLKQDQFKDVRDRLLKSASDFYGKLGALLGKESDLASRRALWQANYEVAELTGKVGKLEDALAAHRQVLTAREALVAETHADAEIRAEVGQSLTAVAGLLRSTTQTKEAEATYRRAEKLLVELSPTIAEAASVRAVLANCRSNFGELLSRIGRYDEALSVYRLVRADQKELAAAPEATAESRRDLADTVQRVAGVLLGTGKFSEAEAEYRKALAIQQKLADENPDVADFRWRVAGTHNSLGNLLTYTGRASQAEAELRKSLPIIQKLAHDYPAVTRIREQHIDNHYQLGLALAHTNKRSEAETETRTALAIQQKLADDNPDVIGYRVALATHHFSLARLLAEAGNWVDAQAEYCKSLAIKQKLADDNPDASQYYQRDLAFNLGWVGWQFAQAGKTDTALSFYRREEVIRQKFADASSAAPSDSDFLANCQINTADVLRREGRLDEALAACERALAVREPLVEAHPENLGYRARLGETYLRLGQVRCDMKNLARAAAAWKLACVDFDGTKTLDGESTFLRACCHAGLAGLAGRPGSEVSAAEGADQAAKAMALLRQAVTMGYRKPDAYRTESALDPLRNRPDFCLLMMDLAFPAEPFAE